MEAIQGMTNAMNAIANQVICNSGRSGRNGGWPYFDGTFRDYPAFQRKFESFQMTYHRGTPTRELFQQFREMCLPEKLSARIKSADTMENAWIRLEAWFGDKALFIKDLMQDIKRVTPIKEGDDERMMDYYVMLQAHIKEARNAGALEMLLIPANVELMVLPLTAWENRIWREAQGRLPAEDRSWYMDVFVNERLRYAINMVATSERHVLPKATPLHHPSAAHHHLLHGALVEGRVMVMQGIGARKAKVFLCREDVRVKGAGKANCLHALYDWGAAVTLVTHAAGVKVGLERKRQVPAAIAGLGGRCTMVDSYYMVPVVDGDDVVRVVKALGVDHIATLAAADITEDIVMRLPRTKGFVEKLARPAGNVEMLIGMDNQGWMPMHVESSRVENDNLQLMQSVLSPRCILMGSVRTPDQGRGTQGSVASPPVAIKQPGGRRSGPQPRNSLWVMMTMMLVMLAGLPECAAFRAYDCNNQSPQMEQHSLLNPEPCSNMEKVHAIERELYGEIVQIKKER